MGTNRKPVFLVLLLGILFFSSSVFSQEEDKAKAKKHFEAGKSLMKLEDYDTASGQFKKSVKLFPTKAAMFNLANCYMALHDYHHALNWYRQLKFKYKDSLGEDLLDAVNEHIREIELLTAKLKIDVKQDGATVKVDGKEVGKSPLTSYVIVAPGKHSVEVSLSGHKVFRGKPKAVLGSQTVLEVDLPKLGASKVASASVARAAPVTKPPIKQVEKKKKKKHTQEKANEELLPSPYGKTEKPKMNDEKKRRNRLSPVPFIITTGATLAFGLSWIAVDAKVTSKYDAAEANQSESLKEEGEKLQKVDGALLGFTLGGVAASLVLLYFTGFKKESEQKKPADRVKLGSIAPVVMNNGGGVAMGGSF